MNTTQLAIILKPICNDPIIIYLITKQLRTMWFKEKQQRLLKIYKKHIDIIRSTNMNIKDDLPWNSYR